MLKYIVLLLIIISFWDCSTKKKQNPNSFEVSGYQVISKPNYEFDSSLNYSNDTLRLSTCSEFVYSPFGEMKNKEDIKRSLLSDFTLYDRTDTMINGIFEFQILKYKNSKLILYFDNDPESSKSSYIHKGEINDPEAKLGLGIQIGMTKEAFVNIFFDKYPNNLLSKYDVIVFQTCVLDLEHIYSFKLGKLFSIKFQSDSIWNVHYN